MSGTHDLLPVGWGLAVPRQVSETLLDMGIACNEAALALDQAYLQHRRSINMGHTAAPYGDATVHQRQFARHWCDCTISYTDQLLAVYTATAAMFATYAVSLVTTFASSGEFSLACPAAVQPSQVLGAPEVHVPLVQIPVGPEADRRIVDHNSELVARHQGLMRAVDLTVESHPLGVFDDRARLTNRPARSVELSVDLAHALHGYAATCAWAIGLATRPPSGYPPDLDIDRTV
jgi:hypothetical protein